MDMDSCSICIENFNKGIRAKVECKCGFEVCRACVKQYLLSQSEEPHCMSCKVEWNRKFLTTYLEKAFISKDLKTHRENILFQRELGMLPETQPYVERQIEIDTINDRKRNIDKQIKELNEEKKVLDDKLRDVLIKKVVQRREFIRQCPNGECHGFLTSNLKCKICGIWACGDCREVKEPGHTCNKDTLETIKVMEKDSKPCPKCSALIFKINGCNVMWCTQCHTSFNWVTLQIETGVIHNPEYFDWIRKTGGVVPRTNGDMECGQEIDEIFIYRCTKNAQFMKLDLLLDILRNLNHIKAYEMPRFAPFDRPSGNRDLRISFMRNQITEAQFKMTLQRRQKEVEKKTEIFNVLQLYTRCMTDLFYRLLDDLANKLSKNDLLDRYETFKKEMNALQEYCNNCFVTIGKTYNCKCWKINEYVVLI